MSRIGKKPIIIPEGVEVKIDGQKVAVRGPKGEVSIEIRPEVKVALENNKIVVGESPGVYRGLTRALLNNMVQGVAEGYEKKLEIEGVGYRANLEEDNLVLQLGFSHLVKIKAPPGIKFSIDKNIITVAGADKELVGQVAARIKRAKPPEPYKGKGIKYAGEQIHRKLGKKAVATAT